MRQIASALCFLVALSLIAPMVHSQDEYLVAQSSLFDVPPRWLVDVPTAGTFPRGHFDIGFRIYPGGGTVANCDIGLSHRFMLGISFGGDAVLSNVKPDWNPRVEFNAKLRVIDEQDYFPAFSVGFNSQGDGPYNDQWKRYTFKSKGIFAVLSRSFYLYNWTSGWHIGLGYSMEYDVDSEQDVTFFGGFDATFKYNLAVQIEYDAALNDNRSSLPSELYDSAGVALSDPFSGKGRGYFNIGLKWLFTENLEIELLFKDLLVNRREAETFARELRITYIEQF